ncbi:ATP-binding cassette domain-containing protein [Corynebacterium yudongzhengii]|uniref:ATP-binding cassette domain-containing protein n=1 Tax=Corynebacterium yudongzhengii TaxID=2080740 RepID=UPI001F341986|nr:ABC transporter ATP-binding protein [Corynebacterium yudongzhengii]
MLNVSDLRISTRDEELVRGISFQLEAGERLGIIGESGSGKTLTALALMGLLDDHLHASGTITFDGTDLQGLSDRRLRRIRGKHIAMIFQEPMTALDPLMRIGRQIAEAAGRSRVDELLNAVQLPPELASRYPLELSGGQRQRVLIAMAIAGDPDLLICDEPTTALDVDVQDQILSLLETLADSRKMALLFVTHDLAVISRMCPEVVVMRDGEIVERGATREVLSAPAHDYTARLVESSQPGPAAVARPVGEPVVEISQLKRTYRGVPAVDGVDLQVRRGERLGLVGGSGSGKTTLLRLIAGLDDPTDGTVNVRGGVQMVFQDPYSSLNPRLSIERSIAEACDGDRDWVREVITAVGGTPDWLQRFPHEFSGGQRQRISIARALAARPEILLADEPVSALDVSVRAQVLDALNALVDDYGLTLIFVTHDLSVVREVCPEIAVMHDGQLVERGETADVLDHPQHDYTRRLRDGVLTL